MGLGGRLRKRARKVAKKATSVAKKVAVPIKGKGAVTSVVHGVEKYGKAVGSIYALGGGGIVGAAVVKKHPDTFGKTGSKVATTLEPIEKVTAVTAGTALGVGGVVSAVTGAIDSGSSTGTVTAGDARDTGQVTAADFQLPSATAGGSSTAVVWIVAGGLVFVALAVALARRRRK